MLCENCGKHDANVKYTQIINGEKKEMNLCEECSKKLGVSNMDFKMPISFSSFLGDFFNEFENDTFLPEFNPIKELKCDRCGMTFEEFMNTGKFGCGNCYEIFESKIDPILKNIHGANRHIGRLGKVDPITKLNSDISNNKSSIKNENQSEESQLKEELNIAIKEERYEDAAIIRDKLKKIK